MYSLCLTGLVTLLSRREIVGAEWIVKSTLSLFEKAIQHGALSESLYVQLLDMLGLMGLGEDTSQVSALATDDHPGSSQLWQARLRLMVTTGQTDVQAIDSLFRAALKHIPADDAWPVWETVLNYHGCQRSEQLDQLMEEACRSPSPRVSLSAKDWCLKWLYRQDGIKKVREFYSRHKIMRPVSLSFYKLYVQMEISQMSPNFDLIRNVFEEALATFGQKEPDLWLNYLKWEAEMVKDSSRSGDIYQRALVALESKLREQFIRKHVMLELEA
ncbi:hypothetical protein Btru_070777 [Bulinus truncatus]|nr:hypothetical protein Btru_070777 [Bulinus truncatus]